MMPNLDRSLGLLVPCLCLWLAACSSDSKPSDAAVSDTGTGGGDDSGGAVRPTLPASNLTCNQIRICASECNDQACINACEARGATAGVTAFQALTSCIDVEMCEVGVAGIVCSCEATCFASSPCVDASDECTQSEEPWVCDNLCH
jgi:hypothetical protein